MFELSAAQGSSNITINCAISRPATIGELEEIRAEINRVTNHRFDISNEPWNYPNYPYLNIYAFSKNVPRSFRWTVDDPDARTKFIKALVMLQELLDSSGIVSSKLTAEIIMEDLIEDRIKHPLFSVGDKVYELQLKQTPQRFDVGQEFKNEVNDHIQKLKSEYSTAISTAQKDFHDELERIRNQDIRLFPLTTKDAFDGWSTFFYKNGPVLAKRFVYSPHYITDGHILWQVTDEAVRKVWRQPGVLAYSPVVGEIIPLRANGTIMSTHHTRSSGNICTGEVKVPMHLEYEDAKVFIRKVIDMLDMINTPSRTASRISSDDPYSITEEALYTDHCKKVSKKPAAGDTTTVSDGDVL